ncbi:MULTISPECIES: hypothetical protein [Dyella]|uniref:Uncharacterized protein n=2 Tax=Dyella TaxID=231454 RepID=A0A4R0YYJ3_9GAMM|nr:MULTISPECIES: hypothetical protein [Dyella]TBR40562.1 hypothetical protein EYV96_10535 [Dyella terrae]TCI11856.1 hypothetical protein EZM97_00335 [Dyella soli]
MNHKTSKWIVLALIGGCYLASLALPAFSYMSHVPPDHVEGKIEIVPGWFAVCFGPMGLLSLSATALPFFANYTFLGGAQLYALEHYRKAAVLAVLSAGLGASFFWMSGSHPMPVLFSGQDDYMNHPVPMLGFYVWMASFALLLLGAFFGKLMARARN